MTALPRTADVVTKLGGVFYKPVGENLKISFENRGGKDFVILILMLTLKLITR